MIAEIFGFADMEFSCYILYGNVAGEIVVDVLEDCLHFGVVLGIG